jgi:diaminopimelate decarboxylase
MTLQNDIYEIKGVSLESVAKEFGTPVYVYDADKMEKQYKKLASAINVKKSKINFACKALSNINVLKIFRNLGAGLDAVSIQEAELGLRAGFAPSDIVYTPNSVSIDEIEKAIGYGLKVNIDNIDTLETLGHKYPEEAFCIRINPHIMAGGNSNISVGHIDSKFGISIHQIPLVERIVSTLDMNIEGVHMHTGSDILDVNVFLQAADILFSVAEKFPNLKYIDFGSGFKVKYKPDDIETDIVHFGEAISERFNTFCKKRGQDITLMFEPGKFLVSEAGFFLARANTIKTTTSTVFAGIDSGFNHLIRPMFYNAYHQITNLSNPNGNPRIYSVVGYICETDTFAWNRKINEIKPGDILAFHNAGAYSFSMASNYNSRLRPAEVLILKGEAKLIRKRETLEDLLSKQVDLDL